jgi:Icc-related predicted phosphoesterase
MIPEGTDVLVTHGPPFGVLDKSLSSTPNLGCEELTKAVEQIRPRLNIFGHVHGGHGKMTANGTQFVNASVVDEAYRLVHEPQVVEMQVIVPRRKMQPKARSR